MAVLLYMDIVHDTHLSSLINTAPDIRNPPAKHFAGDSEGNNKGTITPAISFRHASYMATTLATIVVA